MDLHERVVVVAAGMPRPTAMRTARVSEATIKRYLKRRRATGSRAASRAPGRSAGVTPALAAQITARPDDTLAQSRATWQAQRAPPSTT